MDKRLLPLLASSAFIAVPAVAQDVLPVPDWSGIYIGVIGGYGFGDLDVEGEGFIFIPPAIPYDLSIDAEGAFLGGQFGYLHQFGNFVVGIVGDGSVADIEGFDSVNIYDEDDFTVGASAGINWFGTLRGTAGVSFGRVMVFGTGGLAVGETEMEVGYDLSNIITTSRLPDSFDPTTSETNTSVGFALGGGVAGMLTPNLMADLSALFIDLGSESFSVVDEDDIGVGQGEVDFSTLLVRFGLSYKFP
jgi:outer membrane immunogenic protein